MKKKTPEYQAWCNMRQRCNNPRSSGYNYYGARGIKVAKRWDSFACFLADMGHRPSSEHSLDRINSKGNYSKANCRWAAPLTQKRNRRLQRKRNHWLGGLAQWG